MGAANTQPRRAGNKLDEGRMTQGFKSTEFWLGVFFMILGFSTAFYAISKGADLVGLGAVLGAIGSNSAVYIYGRSKVKAK